MNTPRRPTLEEEQYNDAIEEELDEWDDMILGPVPGEWIEDWDAAMEADYLGEVHPESRLEANVSSSPEDWREFLRKIEEDLG